MAFANQRHQDLFESITHAISHHAKKDPDLTCQDVFVVAECLLQVLNTSPNRQAVKWTEKVKLF